MVVLAGRTLVPLTTGFLTEKGPVWRATSGTDLSFLRICFAAGCFMVFCLEGSRLALMRQHCFQEGLRKGRANGLTIETLV